MIKDWLKHKFKVENYIAICFTIIFILLSNNNSETDAYAYAISVKTGQNVIFHHHLLYCFPARFLFLLIKFIGFNPDSLLLLKLINSVSAGLCIYFFGKILKLSNSEKILELLIFAGSCFGFMRFATEGETYIFPILFSLIATYFFVLFLKSDKIWFFIISSFIFATSILFHQIHIFWFAGFATSLLTRDVKKNISNILSFVLPCLVLTFTVYFLASVNANSTFFNFIFHDYYQGKANVLVGLNNFKMLPVSFVRTFFQAHGYFIFLLEKCQILIAVCIAVIGLAAFYLYKFLMTLKYHNIENTVLHKALLFAFVFQFLFSFYSVSNAEFMVMLPFLAILWIEIKFTFSKKYLLIFSIIMFFWNIVFGLVPLHFANVDGSKNLLSKTKNETWIFYNPQKMENMGEYYLGERYIKKILRLDSLDVLIKKGKIKYVLTDHFNDNELLNRRKFLFENDKNFIKFKSYERSKVDSINYSFGKKYIYKVILK